MMSHPAGPVRDSVHALGLVAKRLARSCYRQDRWPGRAVRLMANRVPSVISARKAGDSFARASMGRVVLLCVYRQRNAGVVRALLDSCDRRQIDTALWALDSVAPELAGRTLGVGPGARCELLNRLWVMVGAEADCVVVCDDDVKFEGGWTLPAMLGAMAMLGVDFAQPAHVPGSPHSYAFNVRRPVIAARTVPSVEIGPLFAVRAPWVSRVVPFPDDAGMGFYLEWLWAGLSSEGCRSAVLDCVPMRHLANVGADYGSVFLGSDRHVPQDQYPTSLDALYEEQPVLSRTIWSARLVSRGGT